MEQIITEITLKDKIYLAISDIEDQNFLEAILVILTDKIDNNKERNNNILTQ